MATQKPEDKSLYEKTKETLSKTFEAAKEKAGEAVESMKHAAGMDEKTAQKENLEYKTGMKKDTGSQVKEGAQSASQKVKEGAQNVADRVKEQTERMREQK